MAANKLTASGQVRQKIIKLMTGKTIKPAEQKQSGERKIGTLWKRVEDTVTAVKEANAARLARAMYDQALSSDDPVVVCAMLSNVEDDGTAGAALLILARQALSAKKRNEPLRFKNERGTRESNAKDKKYCEIADGLGLKLRGKYQMAEQVQKKLANQGEEVSTRTIVRAFHRQKYS
jgi:hypothetical protein